MEEERSNKSLSDGKRTVQTQLCFNIFKPEYKTSHTNTNSVSFSECHVEISEMENSRSNVLQRDKIVEEVISEQNND